MNIGVTELVLLLVIAGVIAVVVVSANNGSAAPAPLVPVSPVVAVGGPESVMREVVHLLVSNGATITFQGPGAIAGHVLSKRKASVLVAILLWFICIIPMVIYLINASKDVQDPFSLTLTPVDGGTRVEGSGSGRGASAVAWVLDQVARSANVVPTPAVAAAEEAAQPRSDSAAEPSLMEDHTIPAAPKSSPSLAAGWYSDPLAPSSLRWWDGSAWTDQTR